jgi:hypothetical protein
MSCFIERAAKARPLRQEVCSGASPKLWSAQHMLPCRNRLFQDLGLDLMLQKVVGSDISRIRDSAISMAEMLCKSEE